MPSGSLAVLALNCLQKSMMFRPCGPSAVPTGGAGVALPAGSCSLMVVCIFLAMSLPQILLNPSRSRGREGRNSAQLFDAGKIEFDRSRAAEYRYGNFQAAVIVVDLLDVAVKICERAIHDAHLFVALEHHFGFRAVLRRMHAVDDGVHFGVGKR